MIRLAAIGHGDIARRRHFPDAQSIPGVALAAIAGRDPARLADTAARFAIPRWTTDTATLLADPAIDAVMILTPPDTHATLAAAAIAAGKHVMIEKPLVRSRQEADALLAAARATPRPRTIFPLPHYATAEFRLLRHLVDANAIGAPSLLEAHRGHRGPTHAGWFYRRAEAGGGVLLDLGIYQLTIATALLGPAEAMTSLLATRLPQRSLDDGSTIAPDVEDSALLTLRHAGGVTTSMVTTWTASAPHTATRARSVLFGRAGTLHFGVADGGIYWHRPDGDYAAHPSEPARFDGLDCRRIAPEGRPGPANIVAAFAARIAAGDTSTRDLGIQAHVMEIIARAYAGDASTPLETGF